MARFSLPLIVLLVFVASCTYNNVEETYKDFPSSHISIILYDEQKTLSLSDTDAKYTSHRLDEMSDHESFVTIGSSDCHALFSENMGMVKCSKLGT